MTLMILLTRAASIADDGRTMRFIGNAGFEITDGVNTVVLDFPYEPGASVGACDGSERPDQGEIVQW